MAFGDYSTYQRQNRQRCTDNLFIATDANKTLLSPTTVNNQLFIQKLTFVSKTAAAQVILLQDTTSTPIVIGTIPASVAAGVAYVLDFGPRGMPLGVGKNLVTSNTAGPAGQIHIEAYERLGATVGINDGAALQA